MKKTEKKEAKQAEPEAFIQFDVEGYVSRYTGYGKVRTIIKFCLHLSLPTV